MLPPIRELPPAQQPADGCDASVSASMETWQTRRLLEAGQQRIAVEQVALIIATP